jgi:hypothetical protein
MITKLTLRHTTTIYIKGQWMDHITVHDTRIYLFGIIRLWRDSNKDEIEYDCKDTPTNEKKVGFKKET